jgi:hypothetical protein
MGFRRTQLWKNPILLESKIVMSGQSITPLNDEAPVLRPSHESAKNISREVRRGTSLLDLPATILTTRRE